MHDLDYDYVPDAEHKLRFLYVHSRAFNAVPLYVSAKFGGSPSPQCPVSGICCRLLTRSNSRGYSRERFLASMRRASMRSLPSGVYMVYVAGYKGVACKVVKN